MLNKCVFERISRLLPLLACFLTPLLFFVDCRDQFELPKLTFLAVLGAMTFGLALVLRGVPRLKSLSWALILLLAVESLASLPGISLSWRTSLLGDYENFAGLLSSVYFLLWYFALYQLLDKSLLEKIIFFTSLAAFLSSLYALAQHNGYDFVQWSPETVIGNRDFASLGNPNFLAAYLAMALPLLLTLGGLHFFSRRPLPQVKGYVFFGFLAIVGTAFLLSGTGRGATLLGQNPNDPPLEVAIVFGLSAFTFALVRFGNMASPLVFAGVLTLLGLGLLRTGSRGGFLGAIGGLTLLVLLALLSLDLRARLKQWLGSFSKFTLYVSGALIVGLMLNFNAAFLNRLTDTFLHFYQNIGTSRLHIWKPALRIIRENPFFGIGLDNFKIAFPQYAGFDFNKIDGIFVSSRTAHNDLLQTASTTGLIGLSVYLAVLVLFLLAWKRTFQTASTPHRWLLSGLLAAAAAYHIQNLFSFGVAAIEFLWILALAGSSGFRKQPPAVPSRPVRLSAILLTVLGVLALSVPALIRLTADVAFSRGSSTLDVLKTNAASLSADQRSLYADYSLQMNERAVKIMPLEVKYRLYLALAFERKADTDPERSVEWLKESLRHYDRSIAMSPANAYYHNNRNRIALRLYALTQDPATLDLADQAGRRAVALAPGSPFFKIQWAVTLKKNGNEKEAERELKDSFALSPDFSGRLLSQLAVEEFQKGSIPFAMGLFEAALQGNPSCVEAYYYRGLVLRQMGKPKESLRDIEKARELNPEWVEQNRKQ